VRDESILVVYIRGTMNTVLLWIGIALLGLALYVSPAFLNRKNIVSEGFVLRDEIGPLADPSIPVTDLGTSQGPTNIESTPNSTAGPSPDLETLMRNAAHKLNGGVNTPDLELPSPSELEQVAATSQGLREQPKEHVSSKSSPSGAAIQSASHPSLQQGTSFQTIKPAREVVVVERPSKPVVKYVKVHTPCPKCPDMRDYIRKDSIPCWNCKLN
jgi:hypothetical protein